MNDSMICDDRANDEADRHSQMMQEQKKEKVTFSGGHSYEVPVKNKTVEVKCKSCKSTFTAKVADRKRGWGKFCSKSCKAKKQTRTMPFNKDTQRSYREKVVYGEQIKDALYFGDVDDDENFGNISIDQDHMCKTH